jgi:choline kinase
VFGTFGNGRVEEYFASRALTPNEMREAQVSRWIGRRMRELHSVDVDEVVSPQWPMEGGGRKVAVKVNFEKWVGPAREVLKLLTDGRSEDRGRSGSGSPSSTTSRPEEWKTFVEEFDIDRLEKEWKAYWEWLTRVEKEHGASETVFCHNDAQYGNLLRLKHRHKDMPNHHSIIVVDFEYAAPNPAAFDIANHFHEWTANYHSDTPHILNSEQYPSLLERQNFYAAYLSPAIASCLDGRSIASELDGVGIPTPTPNSNSNSSSSFYLHPTSSTSTSSISSISSTTFLHPGIDTEMELLEKQVQAWSPTSNALWSVWGIVQAKDDVLAGSVGAGEFDYIAYALGKVRMFREDLKRLGISVAME